jgi:NADH dehydrogenase
VIVGAGFGGLYAARALRRAPVRITLIDRRNHHVFQPLLYEVATAALSAADIAEPIRRIFSRQPNVEVLMGDVEAIDTARRRVDLPGVSVAYDHLIVAAGVTHSYFGHDEWVEFAPGLKTIDDALEIRRRFLLAFEAAEREDDPGARRSKLTFVIVGAGPTGVELAGTMSELARRAIPRDFRSIDTTTARVILVEGQDRVLPGFEADLSDRARRDLEALGVEVRLSSLVTDVDEHGVLVGEARIDAANVFWAAGVRASPLGATLGAPLDGQGRVLVEPDLSLPGHPEVLVIGDLAHLVDGGGRLVPGVAPAAIQMARHAAGVIASTVRGRPRRPAFVYRDKGMLATIGRARAVGRVGRLKLAGLVAWLAWALVHVLFLIGFRNRLVVLLRWAWAYLVFARGARLVTGPDDLALRRPRGSSFDAARAVAADDLAGATTTAPRPDRPEG